MEEIRINDEEFIEAISAINGMLFGQTFDESEQRSSMNHAYAEVQETEITENYTLTISMILTMTGKCYEMMKKTLETFVKIGGEMHSVDALLESCISAIKE